ncbi:NADPH:quinone reductase [Rhodococcus globerulus]|uniref:NADPH:quinone reductase n=1 Tax=Rhodococcus globerulus TaxID=33008 RepID=A0ABU4C3R2_RHOGO|nr:NADPH:quinone reductase [Rhodococcus globerulus]MDV6271008.1 NADPH:quinone reductase [Rhodococcus globerulus]
MKAISFTESGPGSELTYGDFPTPTPGAGEVRVRVRVSGVNPSDWKSRLRGTYGHSEQPKVPHHDGVGVIDEVGDGISEERLGQRVWLYFAAWQRPHGTAAQWCTVPAEQAIPLDDGVPDEVGAALGVPAITAHHLLGDTAALAGRSILVSGFGAVGFAATQLARWAGARVVVSTGSPEKQKAAITLGADAVVDPHSPDAADRFRAALPAGAARIIEPALGSNLARHLAVLAPGGTFAVYATEGDPVTDLPVRTFIDLNARITFTMVYRLSSVEILQATIDITRALTAGHLRGYPVHRFDLEDTTNAQKALASNVFGKVVVDVP